MNLPSNIKVVTPTPNVKIDTPVIPTVSGSASLPSINIKTPTVVTASTSKVTSVAKKAASGLSGILSGIKKPTFNIATVGSIGSIVKPAIPFSLPKLPSIQLQKMPSVSVPAISAPTINADVTTSGISVSGSVA